jgi:drug/metabolite transporter (DMT)-like permease
MLVPIFGVACGALFLGEEFTRYHAGAALLVMVGLAMHALPAKR